MLDRDLVVRRVNSTMAEWYGWSNQAIGQRLFDYRPDYQDFLRQPIAVTLGMGVPQACDEVERLDPSGRPSIRNYYVYPMLEGHTVTGIVLLVEDVTERAMLRDDVNTRAIQMAALSEVSGQITSTLDPDQVINLILTRWAACSRTTACRCGCGAGPRRAADRRRARLQRARLAHGRRF